MADRLSPLGPNPYVGPTPFTAADADRFYGRSEEIGHLTSLVIAHRTVLFYAQSGAGKTSLINAGLLPRLGARNRLQVLPIGSVVGAHIESLSPAPANIFVYNLLSSLYTGRDHPAALIEQGLGDGVAAFLGEDALDRQPHLLIIDQFEEIFTHYVERAEDRSDFFLQLQEMLAAYPRLSLLLSMREDYVPYLDFYTGLMPDRLRIHLRMERLTYAGALEAIRRPAEQAGRRFDEGVAEDLANNLRRVQRRHRAPDESGEDAALGEYIEPVHLQLVCRELWDQLPPDQREIHSEDLRTFGDVDEALAAFYENALARAVAETGVNPRLLRAWFAEELITPARTRSLIYQGETETEGLSNEIVQVLRDAYVVRGVVRGDDLFIELTHDRLIEPILEANATWQAHYANPLAEPAKAWIRSGRSRNHLLRGAELVTAQHFAGEHPQDLLPEEAEFLDNSLQEDRQRRLIWGGIVVAATLLVALLALAFYQTSRTREIEAERAREQARAEAQQKLAEARRLAGLSINAIDTGYLEDGLRLALTAGETSKDDPPAEAFSAIRYALAAPIRVRHVMTTSEQGIPFQAVQLSPDRSQVAAIQANGILSVWDVDTGQGVSWPAHGGQTSDDNLDWHPDGAAIVTGGRDDKTVKVWSSDGELIKEFTPFLTGVRSVGWSPDGSRLAAVDEMVVRIWDTWGDTIIVDATDVHTTTIWTAEWSPDGRYFLTGDQIGKIRLWPVDSPNNDPILLKRHTSIIRDVDWWLDSNLLVSGSRDGTAQLWDLQNFTPITPTLQGEIGSISDASLSPNGEWLFLLGNQGAEIWETATLTRSAKLLLPGLNGRITSFTWRKDGHQLLTGDTNGQVRIWDPSTWTVDAVPDTIPDAILIEHGLNQDTGQPGVVNLLRWNSNSHQILSGGTDYALHRWDLITDQTDIIANFGKGLFFIDEIGNGEGILAAANDGTLRTYRTDVEAELPILHPSNQRVVRVRWNQNEDQILVTSGNAATLWDAQTGELIFGFPHAAPVRDARWIQGETAILTTGEDGFVRIWNAQTGNLLSELAQAGSADYAREDLAGTVIVSGAENGEVRIWDAATQDLICTLDLADDQEETRDIAATVRFQNADSGRVVAASRNGQVQMWDFRTCQKLDPLPTTFTQAREAFWNPDGRTLVIAYGIGGPPLIWDAEKEETVWTLADPEWPITNTLKAEWNGSESLLMTRDDDRRVRIWDMETGAVRQRLEHPSRVSSALWIDDKRIITTDENGAVRIWTIGQEQPIRTIGAEYANARIIGFSYKAANDTILAWSSDGKARLWNAETGVEIATLEGHTRPIVDGAWNRDGSQVMTWSEDGSVRRYYVHMTDLLRSACRLTSASVRPPLCAQYLEE